MKYKDLDLVPSPTDMNKYHVLGKHLENLLWPIGDTTIVGSFANNKAFIRYHDVDVVIMTDIDSESVIVDHVTEIAPEWFKICKLPLDLFVFGDFSSHTVLKYINEYSCCGKITIRFHPTWSRKWLYLKIVTLKFVRSLLEK
jgi:hypothetical protein